MERRSSWFNNYVFFFSTHTYMYVYLPIAVQNTYPAKKRMRNGGNGNFELI